MREKISCIICAYNKEARIGTVLAVVQNHPLIDEVIVVNDASTDKTRAVVQKFKGVRLITCKVNKGKSYSLAVGIARARNALLFLLDADLLGLTKKDVTMLVQPVLSGKVDMSLSLRKNDFFAFNYPALLGVDFISGERVFPKNLVQASLGKIARLPGFGCEVFMNRLVIQRRLHIKVVKWSHVINPDKSEKEGFFKGLGDQFRMIAQILRVVSVHELVYQNYMLRVLTRSGKK